MGTRGAFGFYGDGTNKIAYNHFDSYPSGLGWDVFRFVKSHTPAELKEIFDRIEMIKRDTEPTPEQIAHCKEMKTLYLGVSGQRESDWYCLLRHAQGNLEFYANGLRYMMDGASFIQDSVMCEYAYVINVDTNELEVYEGGYNKNPEPQEGNRYYDGFEIDTTYGGKQPYYPCLLVTKIPFGAEMSEYEFCETIDKAAKALRPECYDDEDDD